MLADSLTVILTVAVIVTVAVILALVVYHDGRSDNRGVLRIRADTVVAAASTPSNILTE